MTVLKKFLKTKNKLRFQNFEKLPKPHALAVQEWLDVKFTTEIQINNSSMSVLSGKKILLGISGGIANIKQQH
jgi:hypothetical protein